MVPQRFGLQIQSKVSIAAVAMFEALTAEF